MMERQKKRTLINMSTLVVMVLVTVCWRNGCCAASARPLEHSPSELAWAAWLQRDPDQPDQQPPPRRITTKSLFVFPHLGQEALPACAEGYRPDSLGRCVKVVKVDESAHLEFLLQKLNSQFATESTDGEDDIYDYDTETDPPDISGPFQFNIPIAVQLQSHKHDSEPEGSGDSVVIVKKDTKPTSSPEVVPDYLSGSGESVSSESQTISITTDGKFEIVTSRPKYVAEDELVVELEGLKDEIQTETGEPDQDERTPTTTTEVALETQPTEADIKHRNKTKTKVHTENGSTESSTTLDRSTVHPAETTTSKPSKIPDENEPPNTETATESEENDSTKSKKNETKMPTKPNKTEHASRRPDTPLNIEDKIKVISRFADVTVNDEPIPPEKHVKRKIPELNLEEQMITRPTDLIPSPSGGLVHFLNEPLEPDYRDLQKQAALHYHRNHPDLHLDQDAFVDNNPYWFQARPTWDEEGDNQQPSNPWAKLPSINEYLYGGYRDQQHNANYQTLYPNLYKPDSARINVRHTATTHRRGRPMFESSRQSEQNESFLPRKNRYPHNQK